MAAAPFLAALLGALVAAASSVEPSAAAPPAPAAPGTERDVRSGAARRLAEESSTPPPTATGEEGVTEVEEAGPRTEARIVNGQEQHVAVPSYVLLMKKGGQHFCSGSLIGRRHVLTAAHCIDTHPVGQVVVRTLIRTKGKLDSASDFNSAFFGGQDDAWWEDEIPTKAFHMPEGWTGTGLQDIGILELQRSTSQRAFQRRVALASVNFTLDLLANDGSGKTSPSLQACGFGNIGPSQSADTQRCVDINATVTCKTRFKGEIPGSEFCFSPEDGAGVCSGDSGGPLYQTYKTDQGLVRVQLGVAVRSSCPQGFAESYNGIWTNTSFYMDWIRTKIGDQGRRELIVVDSTDLDDVLTARDPNSGGGAGSEADLAGSDGFYSGLDAAESRSSVSRAALVAALTTVGMLSMAQFGAP